MAEIISLLADIATALGIPIAIIAFLIDRHRIRREQELETFRNLSDKYFEYLKVVFENPELSTTETEWVKKHSKDDDQNPRQGILVQLAVNMIEAAFYFYQGHRSSFRKKQWSGWDEYLEEWCSHPTFIDMWPSLIKQYDEKFQDHVQNLYQKVHYSQK